MTPLTTAVLTASLPDLAALPAPIREATGRELLYAEELANRPELNHWYCCDPDRALCGANLAGHPETDSDDVDCVVCNDLLGVVCSPTCDYAKWGADPEPDEDDGPWCKAVAS